MKIKMYVVDLEIPRAIKRRLIWVGVPALALVGVAAVALAAVPKTWMKNEPLTSVDLNANFSALDQRLSAVETKVGAMPAGTILAFAGSTCPQGTVAADGSTVQRDGTYAALFAAIGTTYGSTGSTNFVLPNARGVFLRGVGTQLVGTRSYTGTAGSSQMDATATNGLTVSSTSTGGFNDYENGSGSTAGCMVTVSGAAYQNVAVNITTSTTLGPGDSETRPANIAVLYCISY
ncbi:MAG TPA: phage tail protein [Polyangia bacterium]|nr:phage tail protein [Polyangia bacterium]